MQPSQHLALPTTNHKQPINGPRHTTLAAIAARQYNAPHAPHNNPTNTQPQHASLPGLNPPRSLPALTHHVNPQPIQLAVQCTKCITDSPTHTPTFVTTNLATQTIKPTHCPVHPQRTHSTTLTYTQFGAPITFRSLDYADSMCLAHATLSRQLALDLINTARQRNERSTTNLSQPIDAYDLLYTLQPRNMVGVPMSVAFCPITCTCTTQSGVTPTGCGATFTVLRATNGNTTTTPPLYCIYCGTPTVTTLQPTTDETALLSLALHYNQPPHIMQFLYNNWHTNSNTKTYPTLRSYMESELITLLLASMAQPNQVAN